MNVEPVLLALKALFLVLLYIFIWRVIRSAAKDMRVAPQESFILAPSQLAAEDPAPSRGRLRRPEEQGAEERPLIPGGAGAGHHRPGRGQLRRATRRPVCVRSPRP